MAEFYDVETGEAPSTTRSKQFAPQPTEITTSSPGRTDVTQTTGTQQTQQTQQQLQSALNTTPEALQALHSLIASLTERPAISEDDLNLKVPLPVPSYGGGVWAYVDPLTRRNLTYEDAQKLTIARKAERLKLQQASGTVPAGTPEQQRVAGERTTEIYRSREQQGKYSKEAAGSDAQALMNKAIADAMRAAMPQITAASEGAGTSKGTFRALATQEAAVRGGIEGAALGANLKGQYGQIFNQLESTLELLTRQDPNGPAGMLIQALGIAKGIATQGSTTGSTTGTTQSQGTSQTRVGQETKTEQRSYGPTQAPAGVPPRSAFTPEPYKPQTTEQYMYVTRNTPYETATPGIAGPMEVTNPTFATDDQYAQITSEEEY